MADQGESCWLAGGAEEDVNLMAERFGGRLDNIDESSFDLNGTQNNDAEQQASDGAVLPQDEELVKEHLHLQERLKEAMQLLQEKEKELVKSRKEVEEETDKFKKENIDLEEKLKKMEASILDIENKITIENSEVDKLQRICDKETKEVQKQEDSVYSQCSNEYGSNDATSQSVKKHLEFLDACSDIRANYVKENLISVSVMGRRDTKCKAKDEIEILMTFSDHTFQNLINVKVYSEKCSWDDLIKKAIDERMGAVWLLNKITAHFQSVYGLNEEIEPLMKRYAIDWQQEERIVTIIVPGKRQATCILKLDSNYPATCNIECTRVDEQLKEKMKLIKEKVKRQEICTLTEWLEVLHS
eukprot:Seg1320.1 transcript_id=Seg1320.1/GoldUCD/mRNA.D3Y31 product="hypothetical protein" protein_id=Seg1320.1/GoldUCD/D3Y31